MITKLKALRREIFKLLSDIFQKLVKIIDVFEFLGNLILKIWKCI